MAESGDGSDGVVGGEFQRWWRVAVKTLLAAAARTMRVVTTGSMAAVMSAAESTKQRVDARWPLMCDVYSAAPSERRAPDGDRDVERRPDNFFPDRQLMPDTHSHKQHAAVDAMPLRNSPKLGGP